MKHLKACRKAHSHLNYIICEYDQTHHIPAEEYTVCVLFLILFTILIKSISIIFYFLIIQNHLKSCETRKIREMAFKAFNINYEKANPVETDLEWHGD